MTTFKIAVSCCLPLGLLLFAVGCGEQTRHGVSSGGPSWQLSADNPVPGIDFGTVTVTTLRCGTAPGVTVVIWSDLSAGKQVSSNASPEMAKAEGAHTGQGGQQVGFTLTTTDGETASVLLEGAQFTTAAGNLFLISTQGEKPKIAQINTTVEKFPNEPEEIKEFADDHKEVTTFFEAAMLQPAAEDS